MHPRPAHLDDPGGGPLLPAPRLHVLVHGRLVLGVVQQEVFVVVVELLRRLNILNPKTQRHKLIDSCSAQTLTSITYTYKH